MTHFTHVRKMCFSSFFVILLSLLCLVGSAWGDPVSLPQEVRSYQTRVEGESDPHLKDIYKKYLECLTTLNQVITPTTRCDANGNKVQDVLVEREAIPKFLKAMTEGVFRADKPDFPARSVYQLIEYIEKNKHKWTPGSSFKEFSFELKGGKRKIVKIWMDEFKQIHLDFGDFLAEGSFGVVSKVFSYETWTTLARKAFKQTASKQKTTQAEIEMTRKIVGILKTLPAEERVGIAETYSANNQVIFQKIYDTDYISAVYGKAPDDPYDPDARWGDPIPMSPSTGVSILNQTGRGMLTLHKHGLVHSDIKLENIFLNLPKGKSPHFEAALADFGLGFQPADFLQSNPPLGGSEPYLPPELMKGWMGASPEEKIQNIQKRDVFALAVTGGLTFRPDLVKGWMGEKNRCDKVFGGQRTSQTVVAYHHCQESVIREQMAQEEKKEVLDPLQHFLLRGLDPRPEERISSAQWVKATEILKTMDIDHLEDLHRGKTAVGAVPLKKVLELAQSQSIPHLESTPLTRSEPIPEEVVSRLKSGHRNYAIFPFTKGEDSSKSKENYTLAIAYTDKNSKVHLKELLVDPKDPRQVNHHVELLKAVGTIRE